MRIRICHKSQQFLHKEVKGLACNPRWWGNEGPDPRWPEDIHSHSQEVFVVISCGGLGWKKVQVSESLRTWWILRVKFSLVFSFLSLDSCSQWVLDFYELFSKQLVVEKYSLRALFCQCLCFFFMAVYSVSARLQNSKDPTDSTKGEIQFAVHWRKIFQ